MFEQQRHAPFPGFAQGAAVEGLQYGANVGRRPRCSAAGRRMMGLRDVGNGPSAPPTHAVSRESDQAFNPRAGLQHDEHEMPVSVVDYRDGVEILRVVSVLARRLSRPLPGAKRDAPLTQDYVRILEDSAS